MAAGIRWYRRMTIICEGHARRLGITPLHVAGVFAAHSSNTKWRVNLPLATRTLRNMPLHRGTLGLNIRKAQACMMGADVMTTLVNSDNKYKTRMFARACAGDYSVVVVDRWAQGIAVGWMNCKNNGRPCAKNGKGHTCNYVPEGQEYLDIAAAYITVAEMWGLAPSTVQAITWVVARKVR
jgi:hypothetical protein